MSRRTAVSQPAFVGPILFVHLPPLGLKLRNVFADCRDFLVERLQLSLKLGYPFGRSVVAAAPEKGRPPAFRPSRCEQRG